MCPLIPIMDSVPEVWKLTDEPLRHDRGIPSTPEEITRGYLELFEPDIFVETVPGQLDKIRSAPYTSISNKRCWSLSEILRETSWCSPYLDIGVGMDAVYQHLLRTEFQFVKKTRSPVVEFSNNDPEATAFFEVAYGMFPESKQFCRFIESYRACLDPHSLECSAETWKRIESDDVRYPLAFTTCSVRVDFNYGIPSIFVFDPNSATDVIEFWNYRLFRGQVTPFNIHWINQSKEFFWSKVSDNYEKLPDEKEGRTGSTMLFSRSTDIRRVVDVLDLTRADKPTGSLEMGGDWALPVTRPRNAYRDETRPATLTASRQEVRVFPIEGRKGAANHYALIPSLSPEYEKEKYMHGPVWANVTNKGFSRTDERFSETIPSNALNERTPDAPSSLQVQYQAREGYVTLQYEPHCSTKLSFPSMRQSVIGWLRKQGLRAEMSDAGHVADEIIASVGGLNNVRLLADKETIEFLNHMAHSWRQRKGGTVEFPSRTASIGQVQKLLSEVAKKPYGHNKTLQQFVDAGLMRLGIATKCPHCTKDNWFSLDEIGTVNRCERCLKQFDFPQGEIPRPANWKYRVLGPFSTPNYAQGAYSVVLTLAFLRHGLAGTWDGFTYCSGMELRYGQEVRETDFVAWCRKTNIGYLPDPETIIGECKSLGSETFGTKELDRLSDLAQWMPGAFVVVASLRNGFSSEELAGLQPLARSGWKPDGVRGLQSPLIVLTGCELLAGGGLPATWKNVGGSRGKLIERYGHFTDLRSLAMATQEAYLQLSRDEVYELAGNSRPDGHPY